MVYWQEKLLLQSKKWELKVFIGNAEIFKTKPGYLGPCPLYSHFQLCKNRLKQHLQTSYDDVPYHRTKNLLHI